MAFHSFHLNSFAYLQLCNFFYFFQRTGHKSKLFNHFRLFAIQQTLFQFREIRLLNIMEQQ